MTLYIDPPLWPGHGTTWSHLVSDASLAELHDFAAGAGLSRRAFDLDHYDVPATRVSDLVAAGAVATSGRELLTRLTASGLRVRGRDRVAAKRATLLSRWSALLPGVPGAQAVGEELLTRWHQPHRAYHGPGHLTHVLDSLAVLEADAPAPRAVHLALWFHDAVHDGRAGADEEASAALAETLLTPLTGRLVSVDPADAAGPTDSGDPVEPLPAAQPLTQLPSQAFTQPLTAADVAEVARLVLVTRDHAPAADDHNGALVSDADLAILASAPDRYARYVTQVRAEYAHVPDAAFAVGRAAVLEQLVATTPLFRTSAGAARWEATARSNLRAELARLARS